MKQKTEGEDGRRPAGIVARCWVQAISMKGRESVLRDHTGILTMLEWCSNPTLQWTKINKEVKKRLIQGQIPQRSAEILDFCAASTRPINQCHPTRTAISISSTTFGFQVASRVHIARHRKGPIPCDKWNWFGEHLNPPPSVKCVLVPLHRAEHCVFERWSESSYYISWICFTIFI